MTRKEIMAQYETRPSGVIVSPGKFEGEMLYAPYFYDLLLNGTVAYDDDDGREFIDVTDEDRAEFPELAGASRVECYEDDNGFFFCRPVDSAGGKFDSQD